MGAGHAIPTGHGLKRYILAVEGSANGVALAPGKTLPSEERFNEADAATEGAVIGRKFGTGGGDSRTEF
jgi:hypothetical protein